MGGTLSDNDEGTIDRRDALVLRKLKDKEEGCDKVMADSGHQ
jgi:hypothetical protein